MKPMKNPTPSQGTEKVTDFVSPAPEQRTFSQVDDARPYDEAFFKGQDRKNPSESELEALVEKEIAEVAAMREEQKARLEAAAAVQEVEAVEPEPEAPVARIGMVTFNKITPGETLENVEIAGRNLEIGVFSNTSFPDNSEFTIRREIAHPRVVYGKNKVGIRVVDVVQENAEDLNVFKKTVVESHKSKSYKPIRETDIGMSELRVEIDLNERKISSSCGTSNMAGYIGNKCFIVRGNNIFDFGNSGVEKELAKGDVIFVASNSILQRLMAREIGVKSMMATAEFKEAALVAELRTLFKKAENEDGEIDQGALFKNLSEMYAEGKVVGPETKTIATYVAYQVP